MILIAVDGQVGFGIEVQDQVRLRVVDWLGVAVAQEGERDGR